MRIFDKYKRRAVVIMPCFEAYNEILSKNNNIEQSTNEACTSLVNDMKGKYEYHNQQWRCVA